MTVSNQTNRTSAVGTGAEQIVPFLFPITLNSDIVVTTRVTATGVEATLTETTDYTVDNNGSSGGSITTVTPFVASSSQIHIVRDTPNTQGTDLQTGGAFNADNVEGMSDKATKLTIENVDGLDRTLKFPTTDPADSFSDMPNSIDRASKNLTFDSTGKPTASVSDVTGAIAHSTIGTNIAGAANAQAERALIELDTTDDVIFASVTTDNMIAKLPLVNVMHPDFGATGLGVADDYAAIQAAIDSLPVAGGVVYFPDGTYIVLTTLAVPSNVTLAGNGVSSIITTTDNTITLITINGTKSGSITDTMVSNSAKNQNDIVMTSDTGTTGFTAGDDLLIEDDDNCELNKLASETGSTLTTDAELYDNYTTASSGAVSKLTLKQNIVVESLKFVGVGSGTGDSFNIKYASDVEIKNCYFTLNDDMLVDSSRDINIHDNIYDSVDGNAVQVTGSKYVKFNYNTVKNGSQGPWFDNRVDSSEMCYNNITDTPGGGMTIGRNDGPPPNDNNLMQGNSITDTGAYGILLDAYVLTTATYIQKGNKIIGNTIKQTTTTSIAVTASDNTVVTGNHIEDSASTAITLEIANYNTVTANQLLNIGTTSSHHGILLETGGGGASPLLTSNYNTITANQIDNCTGDSIKILIRSATGLTVAHNTITANSISNGVRGINSAYTGVGAGDQFNMISANTIDTSSSDISTTDGSMTGDGTTVSATSLDLSGAASTLDVFRCPRDLHILAINLVYTEAASADAGIVIQVGVDDDPNAIFDGTSENSASAQVQYYTKTLTATDFIGTSEIRGAGDVITFTSAGSKAGAGEIKCIIEYAYR